MKKQFRYIEEILVPTDFSAVAEFALQHALGLAQFLQSRICLLHVYSPPPGTVLGEEDPAYQDLFRDLLKYTDRYRPEYDVLIDPVIREGNLFRVVNAVVAETRPGIMIMGTHGKQGLQQLFGSHALKVVLDSPCPVMVVHQAPDRNGFRRILVPLDGDADPARLVEWMSLFSGLYNPEIHLFPATEASPGRNILAGRKTEQITAMLKQKRIPFRTIPSEIPGEFSTRVIEYATEVRCDLVMAMSMPATDAAGYNFSDFDEHLMFNPGGIPVLFIDRADGSA